MNKKQKEALVLALAEKGETYREIRGEELMIVKANNLIISEVMESRITLHDKVFSS